MWTVTEPGSPKHTISVYVADLESSKTTDVPKKPVAPVTSTRMVACGFFRPLPRDRPF